MSDGSGLPYPLSDLEETGTGLLGRQRAGAVLCLLTSGSVKSVIASCLFGGDEARFLAVSSWVGWLALLASSRAERLVCVPQLHRTCMGTHLVARKQASKLAFPGPSAGLLGAAIPRD
jgi:hypothetical protein